jgi:phosphate transport system substrate-binding protein
MRSILQRAAVAVLALGLPATIARADTNLSGGGATFPAPIYKRWVEEYQKQHPDVKINYEAQGSGFGIKGITQKTLDFAGSDAPMSKKEMDEAAKGGGEVVHLPTVAGAVVAAYNLPGYGGELKLTGPVLAEIFMGKITKWNDARIAALNSGAALPDTSITPVYRTDGSGTNFVFTNYLATQSEGFKSSVGAGKEVKWPTGQGGKGNAGVTAVVQQTNGAIGYVELNYALQNKLGFALLQNKDGNFVKASADTVAAAGEGAVDQMGKSLAVNIWNQSGKDAYPISAFTYMIVYKDLNYLKSPDKKQALVDFLKWAEHDGQQMAKEMDYAPLSPSVQKKVDAAIDSLKK